MAEKKPKFVIPKDEENYHTLVRLLVDCTEALRKDFSSMADSSSYANVTRVRKHITNVKRILKEMSEATRFKREAIRDARWGGVVPSQYRRSVKKRKSDTEPLIL